MTYNLVITDEAQDDFAEILAQTEERWGNEQRQRYAAQVNTALPRIEDNPRPGTRKPDQLPPSYFVYHVGRHYVVYRIEGPDVIVFRILHERMDLKRHIQ